VEEQGISVKDTRAVIKLTLNLQSTHTNCTYPARCYNKGKKRNKINPWFYRRQNPLVKLFKILMTYRAQEAFFTTIPEHQTVYFNISSIW